MFFWTSRPIIYHKCSLCKRDVTSEQWKKYPLDCCIYCVPERSEELNKKEEFKTKLQKEQILEILYKKISNCEKCKSNRYIIKACIVSVNAQLFTDDAPLQIPETRYEKVTCSCTKRIDNFNRLVKSLKNCNDKYEIVRQVTEFAKKYNLVKDLTK
jgi:hypothetical protein